MFTQEIGLGFYDRLGGQITEDAPFYRNGSVAFDFTLYDLDNDEIPEILIYYINFKWGFNVLYKFVNGQYRPVEVEDFAINAYFYREPNGKLVLVESDHADVKVSYLGWDVDGILQDVVLDWDSFTIIWWDDEGYRRDNPYVPGIGQLTPIAPITALEESVRKSITQRLAPTLANNEMRVCFE